ncbi:hypothetical protein N0V85_009671, partial [Neurospora sp. IMI 360204]
MELKPIGFASFNAATSSQRDSVSLNDASVNAKAIADSLKVDFAVSPGLLRSGDWREGGDYHLEVVVAKLVVVCNAERVLCQLSEPVPAAGPGQELAWLERQRARGVQVAEQRLEKAWLGLGTGVNEGVRTQKELMSKWRIPMPPPVPERPGPSGSVGVPGAGTGPAGHLTIQPGGGHVGGNAPHRPYVGTYEFTHNHNNSGRSHLELISHFHNTSPATYNYKPSTYKPHSNNNTLPNEPSHFGNSINNASNTAAKRRRLHHGTRRNPGDPVRNGSEATHDNDSASDYIDEPTAETSAVTTRAAKRRRRGLQSMRDGVAAIAGEGRGSEGASAQAAPASASASTAASTAAATATNTSVANGAITDTNKLFPNLNKRKVVVLEDSDDDSPSSRTAKGNNDVVPEKLHTSTNNVTSSKKTTRDNTSPLLSELKNDDIIAATLEKHHNHNPIASASEESDEVALLDNTVVAEEEATTIPSSPSSPLSPLLGPFAWERESEEDEVFFHRVSEMASAGEEKRKDNKSDKSNNHNNNVLVVEISARGNRDFAEWQRISWEEGLEG